LVFLGISLMNFSQVPHFFWLVIYNPLQSSTNKGLAATAHMALSENGEKKQL
jgi:hypothetical protein